MKKISIVGAGQIGKNLALKFCGLNIETFLFTRDIIRTEKEIRYLKKLAIKTNKKLNFIDNDVIITDSINDISDSSLIIESISEKFDLKKDILAMLSSVSNSKTLIATTTSTKSITALSESLRFKENFLGLHFFNPPTIINFLEIIKGKYTSDKCVETVTKFLDDKEIKYILINKETPGFIVNRALFLMLNEVIFEFDEKLGTAQDIDKAFKLGLHHPMGPLELCDFIGLDIVFDILTTLYEQYKDEKYCPSPLLKKKVMENKLGRKSKEGFYVYR